jgi:heme exporter protein D
MSQINEFLQMGGYALYVWSSYGLGVVVLLLNTVLPMRHEKQIIQNLKKRQERE